MGQIDGEWILGEVTETPEELAKLHEEHLELCKKNREEMTPEEYRQWMNFFD